MHNYKHDRLSFYVFSISHIYFNLVLQHWNRQDNISTGLLSGWIYRKVIFFILNGKIFHKNYFLTYSKYIKNSFKQAIYATVFIA